jgi:A/G-specific adenine glycosylase
VGAAAQLAAWGVTALQWRRTLHAKHVFTHLCWQMTGYLLTVAGAGQPDWLWAGAAARRQRAIPSAFQAFTAALEDAPQESNERKGD